MILQRVSPLLRLRSVLNNGKPKNHCFDNGRYGCRSANLIGFKPWLKCTNICLANSGLGFEAAKALCQSSESYEIIIGSRDVHKGNAAIETIKRECPESVSSLSVVQLDLTEDKSVDTLVEILDAKYGRLDVLVNNAGASFDTDINTGKMSIRDGYNASWDVNVTGTQVLTCAVMPLLFKSSERRILFVTSGTASLIETEMSGTPMFDRNNSSPASGWPKVFERPPITSYRCVKTGLNMMMREWERTLRADGFKLWCISPGFLATGLGGIGAEKLKKVRALYQFPREV